MPLGATARKVSKFGISALVGFGCALRHGLRGHARNDVSSRKDQQTAPWGIPWHNDWDSLPTVPQRGAVRHIVLIRHGQYRNVTGNDEKTKSLTELGEKQAKLTGEYLRAVLDKCPLIQVNSVSNLYASDLLRAQQTASLIFPEAGKCKRVPGVVVDPLLRERFPCDVQPPISRRAPKESEQLAVQCFRKFIHRPSADAPTVDVIVAHANMIRYLVCCALQLPPEAWLRISLPHCSITTLQISGRGHVQLGMLGSVGHIPPSLQSVE